MLFENRKQVTARELMQKYASLEDLKKIEKAPSFEITKDRKIIDRANGGRIKVPKGLMMLANFKVTDPKSGLKVEIRYAKSSNSKIVGDRMVDTFEPRYVETKGATFAHQNDLDLAVYKFLHPNNAGSPLIDSRSTGKPKFEFIDTKKRADAKMDTINAYSDAIEHAKRLNDDRVLLLSKGLGIKGIDKKELDEIRVDLLEFAMKNPKPYLQKANTELTYIEGSIVNLIDKGVVKLNTVGAIRRWVWNSGQYEGEFILDIQSPTQDAKQSLKNFFFNDINRWKSVLDDLSGSISAREKAMKALQVVEVGGEVNVAHQEDVFIGDALPPHLRTNEEIEKHKLPNDNTEAMDFLKNIRNDGKAPSWGHVNKLMSAIGASEATEVNVVDWVKTNLGY